MQQPKVQIFRQVARSIAFKNLCANNQLATAEPTLNNQQRLTWLPPHHLAARLTTSLLLQQHKPHPSQHTFLDTNLCQQQDKTILLLASFAVSTSSLEFKFLALISTSSSLLACQNLRSADD